MKRLKRLLALDYKKKAHVTTKNCITYDELYSYVKKELPKERIKAVESHIAACYHCLDSATSIYRGVKIDNNRLPGADNPITKWRHILKKGYIFLMLAVITFVSSFIFSGYFLQFLTATIIFGVKWIVDSKTNRMLVMIYDAWRADGERGAGRVLRDLEAKNRIN